MEDPIVLKRFIIQRTGRKLIVEVAEDDTVYLVVHHDGEEPRGLRFSRESLLYMMQSLEYLDFEVEVVEGKSAELTLSIP